MKKTWYISALPEWYNVMPPAFCQCTITNALNVKATRMLSVNVPLHYQCIGSHKYIRVKIFQIFCLKVDSIFLAKNAHPVHWGHISMLNADLACMEQLLGRWYINQLKIFQVTRVFAAFARCTQEVHVGLNKVVFQCVFFFCRKSHNALLDV